MLSSTESKIKVGDKKIIAGGCPLSLSPCVSLNATSSCDIAIGITDGTVSPLYAFKAAVKLIARLLSKERKVGVCCSAGCGRTGTAVSTYLILYEGFSGKEALRKFIEARGCGPETAEQFMLIAAADKLRERGIVGDEAVDMLDLPRLEFKHVVITTSDSITVGEVSVAPLYASTLLDIIIDLARTGKKVRVPVTHIDLAVMIEERLGGTIESSEGLEVVKRAKELEEYAVRLSYSKKKGKSKGSIGYDIYEYREYRYDYRYDYF